MSHHAPVIANRGFRDPNSDPLPRFSVPISEVRIPKSGILEPPAQCLIMIPCFPGAEKQWVGGWGVLLKGVVAAQLVGI